MAQKLAGHDRAVGEGLQRSKINLLAIALLRVGTSWDHICGEILDCLNVVVWQQASK